jgi:hypothetical protein
MTEAEVVAFVYFAGEQFLLQNSLGKLPRGHERKVSAKGQQENGVNSSAFQ